MLWVGVAGGVRAEVEGVPVPDTALGGRQGRRVLARLAWEGRPVHRDELADGIWVETLPRTWERTLSGVVTRLRTGLAAAGASPDIVSFSDGRYTIAPTVLQVDVVLAGADLGRARSALRDGAAAEAAMLAITVLDVARRPLLPGDDASWVDLARDRHRSLLLDALDVYADASMAVGSFADAEGAAREAIHWDPIREAGHQRLIGVLAQSGDRAAALEAYHTCRRTLGEELGVEPSAATESLVGDLLGAAVPTRATGRQPRGAGTSSALPSNVILRTGPLVGRELELVQLWAAWRQARLDAPLVAWVHGATGSGVRTLIAAFAREVHAAGAVVVRRGAGGLDADEGDGRRPRPVLELAGHHGGNAPSPASGTALLVVEARCPPVRPGMIDVPVGPLGRAAIAELADERLAGQMRATEVDDLLACTSGTPALVIAALDRICRERTAALATRATDIGHEHVDAHEALVDELVRSPPVTPAGATGGLEAPYKGLVRFEADDADVFFGREHLVARVLAQLAAGNVVTVLGASGTGKSSLVRAGVVARLRHGALPGSDRWPVVVVRPGVEPAEALARCIAVLAEDTTPVRVLVVDQLEELFTLGASPSHRSAFVDSLIAWKSADDGHRLLIVVRSDYFDACTCLAGWSGGFGGTEVVVGPPTDHELRRIVSLPSRAFGTTIEPDLVDLVVREAGGAVGALPLVSTALLGAWQARTDAVMSVRAYVAAGGVGGAIAQLAEQVWAGLDIDERGHARSMFLRLAGGPADDVSTPVPIRELGAGATDVVRSFLSRRLLTVDGDHVQVAHEALLREWPRLRGWLADARHEREVLAHLRHASAAWAAGGRDDADLYRGNRLSAGVALGGGLDLTATEREFLTAGTASERTELLRLRTRSARLKALSAALVVLLVVAVGAAGAAVVGRREVTDRERIAVAQGLVVDAASAGSLDLGLLLAAEARRLDDSPEAQGALLDLLNGADAVERFLRGAPAHLSVVTVDPLGRTVAAGAVDGSVSVWRLDAELPSVVSVVQGPVTAIAFAPNGELAVASGTGELVRWRVGAAPDAPVKAHAGSVLAVAYRRDGDMVTVGADGLMRRFASTDRGVEPTDSTTVPIGTTATFAAAGSVVALLHGEGSVRVLDVASGRPARGLEFSGARPTAVALSADGRTLVTGDDNGDVVVHDLAAETDVRLGNVGTADASPSTARVRSLALTVTGDVLATSGESIALFERTSREGRPPVRIAGSTISDVVVASSGETAVAVTDDGEAILLVLGRSLLGTPLADTGGPVSALVVMDSGPVLAGGADQLSVIDTSRGGTTTIAVPGRPVTALASATDEPLIAVGGRDVFVGGGGPHGTTTVVDLAGVVSFDRLSGAAVTAVAWAGRDILAVGTEGGSVQLIDKARQRIIRQMPVDGAVVGLARRGDTSELVGLTASGKLNRWSSSGDRLAPPIDVGPSASALAFAPDERTVAVATPSGIALVELDTGRVDRRLGQASGTVRSMAFGLGGRVLAAADRSGDVELWDVTLRRRLGTPLPGTGGALVVFDHTGDRLVTGDADGDVVVWDISPDQLSRRACEAAGRTLTQEEWHRFLPGRDYDPACT